jgi:hypothetical protein
MFNKAYDKYSQFKKKISTFNAVSAHYLYELILNKKIKFKISFISIIIHIFLLILSLYSILNSRFKKVNKAQYFVIFDDKLKDPRSINIHKHIVLNSYINFVRTRSFLTSLKVFFKYPNVVFFQSIFVFSYFVNLRVVNQRSIKDKYQFISKIKIFQFKCIEKIFFFLKIKKFIMIDDYREIQGFIEICEKLKIFSVAYMHSRFSKFRVALAYKVFDKYIVWSNFFKKQLLKINPKYKKRIIINNFNFYKKHINIHHDYNPKKIIILYFFDMYTDFLTIKFYLKKILKNKNFKIYFKIKNNEYPDKRLLRYARLNKIFTFKTQSIQNIVDQIRPHFFMAANSNVLLEATLYNCFPVMLKTKNDYSLDLAKNKSVIMLDKKKKIYKFMLKLLKQNSLKERIYNKIWGSVNNNKYQFKRYVK